MSHSSNDNFEQFLSDNQKLLSVFKSPVFASSYFLSIEGIEGSGKSTQLAFIKQFLEQRNLRVLILREPGGTTFGERLRQAVLQTQSVLHPLAEAHLFAASRAQLLHEVIIAELSIPNTVIICDRYIDSSLVYQGKARGLGYQTILQIHQNFPLNLVPHLTFLLEIGLETSRQRQIKRNNPKDYFESQGDHFYKKLIDGYADVKKMFPGRVLAINGEQETEQVSQDITAALEQLLDNNHD